MVFKSEQTVDAVKLVAGLPFDQTKANAAKMDLPLKKKMVFVFR